MWEDGIHGPSQEDTSAPGVERADVPRGEDAYREGAGQRDVVAGGCGHPYEPLASVSSGEHAPGRGREAPRRSSGAEARTGFHVMMRSRRRVSCWPLVAAALVGCAEPRSGSDAPRSGATAEAGLPAAAGEARLDSAARRVVAFLRGEVALDAVRLADTVVLRLAPEGGGHEVRLARAALGRPAAWAVPAGRTRYALAPPAGMAQLTTVVGRHFNCRVSALAERAPAWAAAPHVGVRLTPDGAADSCLRSWNATLVFDTSAASRPPQLVGVLYDQWEW